MYKSQVPESFKVLIKELQSLCLDVRILDENGDEIELKDDCLLYTSSSAANAPRSSSSTGTSSIVQPLPVISSSSDL